jgi:hypothetical protein
MGALSEAIDAHTRAVGERSDLGEMAQLAAAESLSAIVGRSLPGLFGPTAEEVQQAIGRLATSKQFSDLARDFLARLTRRHLTYYLSRELSNHVGPGGRFASIADHSEFNADLDQHCRETAGIVKEFAGDWFGKSNYEGGITPEKAQAFLFQSFKKIGQRVAETAGCSLTISSYAVSCHQPREMERARITSILRDHARTFSSRSRTSAGLL